MTQEEKAKAYDEALKKARKLLNMILDNELLGFPDQIREIFPQLRESNDERIREELIEYHKRQFENNRDQEVGLFHKDAIAYLEKQKVFSNGEGLYYYRPDGDCTFIGTGLGPVEDIMLNGERPKTENKGVALPGACLCEEKQKEPHKRLRDKTPWIVTAKEELAHAEERLQANLEELHRIRAEKEKQKEQKPAECIEDSVKFEEGFKAGRESGLRDGQKYVLNNLDSYGLCKLAERSEMDELMMKAVIGILDENDHPKLCSWLKSRRPQYHGDVTMTEAYKMGLEAGKASSWKPSEEHLSALLAIFNDPNNIGSQTCQLALTDLYEQLKKL